MSVLVKILIFVLFLASFGGFLFWANTFQKRTTAAFGSVGATHGLAALAALATTGAFTWFIYLLSRFFDVWLTGALLIASLSVVILNLVIRGLLGSRQIESLTLWASMESYSRSKAMAVAVMVIGGIVVVGIPLAAGIVYFTRPVPSPSATIWIVRIILLGFFAVGELLVAVTTIQVLLAETVDDEARNWLLASRIIAATSGAFTLALVLSAFTAVQQRSFSLGGVVRQFSPGIVLGVMLYLVLTSVLPYLVGSRGAARYRRSLLEERTEVLGDLIDSLTIPEPSAKTAGLEQVLARLIDRQVQLQSDPLVALAERVETEDVDQLVNTPEQRPYIEMLKRTGDVVHDRDPRLRHLRWVRKVRDRVAEIVEEIKAKTSQATIKKAALEWAGHFQPQREETRQELVTVAQAKSKTGRVVAFGLLSSGLLSTLTSETAKLVFDQITSAA